MIAFLFEKNMEEKNKETKKINKELELLRNQGVKLGFLIKYLNLPEKTKEELTSLVPQMNIEQIERLSNILEAKFLNEQTKQIDKKCQQKIEKLYNDYQNKQKELDIKFLNQVNEIISL